MTAEIKHSPLPWKVSKWEYESSFGVADRNDEAVASFSRVYPECSISLEKEDAEFIVRACNNFDALVTGIQAAMIHIENEKVKEYLQNILAKAEKP